MKLNRKEILIYKTPTRRYEYGSFEPLKGKWEAYYNQIMGHGETKQEAVKDLESYYER